MADRVSVNSRASGVITRQKQLYRWVYLASYLAFSFASTQFTPFLSSLGYGTFARGLLLASYAVTTLFFQLILGVISDKYRTVKKVLALVLLVYALASLFFFNLSEQHFFWHMLLIAISGGLLNTATGLLDTWVLQSPIEVRKSLSFLKAFGSIGWALGSLSVSIVVLNFGYRGLGLSIVLWIAIAVAIGTLLDDIIVLPDRVKTDVTFSDVVTLLKDKRYSLLVLILFLLYFVIICNNITVIDKMLELKASTAQIGFKWSIQSFFEIPAYLIGGRLLQKIKGDYLLTVCAVALFVQFILYANATTVQQIVVISGMQMLTTPLLMVSSKVLIYELSSEHMKATGQMLALSIFIGLGSMVSPVVAGFFVQWQGITFTLLSISIIPLIAIGLLLVLRKMGK
ncbi:MFS transporter [uncultured Vagococcus sp.]|uniref:MFS transporter n=1 Tax=uncultured Vagococcus sp. TaxID=189676 RepID=UPI0028D4C8FD|nr:MFS transporter [uncultured Vagococcus sp.]